MAIRGKARTVQFTVWDNINNIPKTGDSANVTLRWIKDGTLQIPSAPNVTEISSTNAPGQYKADLTNTECDCDLGTICGISSSTGCVIIPLTYSFENGPDIADAVLIRDWSSISGTIPARCLLNAGRFIRNKWAINTNVLSVKKENGTDEAFNADLTVDAQGKITAFTPST